MNICYLINQLAPGGAPTLLLDIVRQNKDPNIKYTIAFIEGDDTLVKKFEKSGAQVIDFNANFKFDPQAIWRIARFFRQHSFDIVHTHLPYAQSLGRVAAQLGKHEAIVSTQHNFSYHYHPVTRATERITRPLDDVTIAVSNAVKSEFNKSNKKTNDEWRTIYNGVDIKKINKKIVAVDRTKIRGQNNISKEDHVFLCVGRYVKQKNQSDIIRAFSDIEINNIQLFLVGWGPNENKLKSMADDCGVSDCVTVTGQVPEVWPYYAASDTFVSSSKIESFGIVLVEAMAAGLPIVATNVPGAREVLNAASSGVKRIPPNNPAKMKCALTKYASKPIEIDYEKALNKFDIEQTTKDHLELYRELGRSD